jgi:hypothetical protein
MTAAHQSGVFVSWGPAMSEQSGLELAWRIFYRVFLTVAALWILLRIASGWVFGF